MSHLQLLRLYKNVLSRPATPRFNPKIHTFQNKNYLFKNNNVGLTSLSFQRGINTRIKEKVFHQPHPSLEDFQGEEEESKSDFSEDFETTYDKMNEKISPQEEEEILRDIENFVNQFKGATGGLQIPHTEDLSNAIKVNQAVDMGRHTKVTAQGRVFSYSAVVIVGTGNGTAGLGYGKSDKPNTAVSKAQVDAQKKMVSIARWHYSMPRTIITHYRGTKIVMIARRPGYGVTGHPVLLTLAKAFGLKDITIKTYRSRNTRKILAAFINCLVRYNDLHPLTHARGMGKKFISTEDFWKPPPPPPKPKPTGGWSTVVRPDAEDRDVIINRLMTYDETTIKEFALENDIDLVEEEPEDAPINFETSNYHNEEEEEFVEERIDDDDFDQELKSKL